MDAYGLLQERLNLWKGLPYTLNWSAAPDFLEIVVDHCYDSKPSVVLECGSGLTTLMLARCCQLNQQGHVYSLEDGDEFAKNIRAYLDRYDLCAYASVIHAPLQKLSIDGKYYDWYAKEQIPDSRIDMLIIDGPSGFIQKNSRYPAIPILLGNLTQHCMVFLDDAAREDEREIVELWKKAYPAIEHEYVDTERGCSVLKIHPVQP